MKKLMVIALFASLVGCAEEPMPSSPGPSVRPRPKAAPSVSTQKAEDFRAVERPASYSQ